MRRYFRESGDTFLILFFRENNCNIISMEILFRNIPLGEKLAASNATRLSLSPVIKALATSSQFRSGQHANNARDVVFEPCTTVATVAPYSLGGKKEGKKERKRERGKRRQRTECADCDNTFV